MRLALAVATWALVSTFPQGKLYRMEREESDSSPCGPRGTSRRPPGRSATCCSGPSRATGSPRTWPTARCSTPRAAASGAKDLPGCRKVWVYERYEPPLMSPRDYAFRMEVVVDDVDQGGDFELRWAARR